MQTNADKALECRQNADKKGENMKKLKNGSLIRPGLIYLSINQMDC